MEYAPDSLNNNNNLSLEDKAKYMVMQMIGDKCYPGRGKWVKIPLFQKIKIKEVLTTSEPYRG